MIRRFPSKDDQFRLAKLVLPIFQYLRSDTQFKNDVTIIRLRYQPLTEDKNLLFVLHQEYWNPGNDSMKIVNNSGEENRKIWEQFHHDIEDLCVKYCITAFPSLVKDFVFTYRFGDLFTSFQLRSSTDGFEVKISRNILREDFEKIWEDMQSFNRKYPLDREYKQYSQDVLDKYQHIQKANGMYFTDQKNIRLLIKQEIQGNDESINNTINTWDKTKKSKLKKVVSNLFSLLDDINSDVRPNGC